MITAMPRLSRSGIAAARCRQRLESTTIGRRTSPILPASSAAMRRFRPAFRCRLICRQSLRSRLPPLIALGAAAAERIYFADGAKHLTMPRDNGA